MRIFALQARGDSIPIANRDEPDKLNLTKQVAYISEYSFTRILRLDFGNDYFRGDLFEKPIYFLNTMDNSKLYRIKYVLQFKNLSQISLQSNRLSKYYNNWIVRPSIYYYHQELECKLLLNENLNVIGSSEMIDDNSLFNFRSDSQLYISNFFRNNNEAGIYEDENFRHETIRNINKVIKLARLYYYDDDKISQNAIRKFGKDSFLYLYDFESIENDTGLSDFDLHNLLEEYHSAVIRPIYSLLLTYNRSMLNPNLEFKRQMLESLNFKACPFCY